MRPSVLFCVWWLVENGVVHYATFHFLLGVTRAKGRRYLPLWLAVNAGATLAVILWRPPGAFLLYVLLLAGFARLVLKIPGPELIVPVAAVAVLCTLKEGFSAFLLSWLSVSFRSPAGGMVEQLFVPLLLDGLFFVLLHMTKNRYSDALRPLFPSYLLLLLPSCVLTVLSIRWGLRLDCSDFEPYLAAFGGGARLSALCAMAGAAVGLFTVFAAFCRLTRLSGREQFLRGQVDAQKAQMAEAKRRGAQRAAFQHDIENHLLVISGLLRERSFVRAEQYVNRLQASSGQLLTGIATGNPVLDVLLREKLSAARHSQIAVTQAVDIPEDFGVEDMDLCAIFSNILDNAVAACQNEPLEERIFTLSARVRGQLLVIEAVNSTGADGPIVFGTGLNNIRYITEKYQGTMETELSGGRFRISVLLCSR